jgi:hypothetical protein
LEKEGKKQQEGNYTMSPLHNIILGSWAGYHGLKHGTDMKWKIKTVFIKPEGRQKFT